MKDETHSENPPIIIPHSTDNQHPVSSANHTAPPQLRAAPGVSLSCSAWNLGLDPWPKPVEGKPLLDELANVLANFVLLPQWVPEALALWTVHTHAFHLREITAYLGIESPKRRRGKSTLLAVLTALVNRPVVSSSIRPSPFLRLVEETQPTLLIDEAETLLCDNDDLRDVLDSGYTRSSAFVVRVINQPSRCSKLQGAAPDPQSSSPGSSIPIFSPGLDLFSVWCPKAMATLGRLPDTFADRCVRVRTRRKTPQDRCERLRNLSRYANSLRRKSARFVLDYSKEIAAACPELPSDLDGRAAEIWEPLLVLADLAGERWPDLARQAAVALTSKQNN